MEKRSNLQLELFTQVRTIPEPKKYGNFFRRIRGYEKALITIMALALTSIASFSLGVEKGKNLSVTKKTNAYLNLARVIPKSEPDPSVQARLEKETNNYTIQVASFQSRPMAKRETQLLKQKGLNPLILSKGKYVIVCVGSFAEKKFAEALLTQLKRRYRDCLIRRL
ncbi:MAG TPA: SPOR domain-containing protein [Candidatus Omnitrophota bacterium]|nr:SPOR domain-containing protein [Candidatus Omnitrophota bacterium]